MSVFTEKPKNLLLSKNQKFRVGFTLIELLIVIAIIGILAALIVASTRSARDRGKNTRVNTSLNQVRLQAALIFSSNSSFVNLCAADNTLNDTGYPETLGKLETDIEQYNGGGNHVCYATITTYCVQSSLVTGEFYCLDHTGYLGKIANCAAGNIQCAP